MFKNIKSRVAVGASALAASASSFAATDLTGITGAFTAGDIVTGVLAVGATLAVVFVTIKGVKIVLTMLRG